MSITIPEGVTRIGSSAFSGCSSLTGITISSIESWLNISYSDFYSHPNCSSSNCHLYIGNEEITSITIPEGVTSIGDYAFSNCSSLTSIMLPEGVTSIGNLAFYNCSNLTSIIIPEELTLVGYSVFPDNIVVYANKASEGAKTLSKANYKFHEPGGNISLRCLIKNDEVTGYEVCGCDNGLTELIIPEYITSIGYSAFSNSSLESITIPDGLTEVGSFAFPSNVKIYANRESEGAKTVTKAGRAFYEPGSNFKLVCILTDDEITGYEIRDCDSEITSFVIPDYVTSIGSSAFSSCSNLTSITIPEGVTNIGDHAFSYNLSKVVFLHPDDESISISFADYLFSSNPTIYCYMFSPVDTWATGKYTVVYLDDVSFDDIRTVQLPADFRMAYGESETLIAELFPIDGTEVEWSSSDSEIVSVENGLINAVGAGQAVVTAVYGNVSASVTIDVFIQATAFEYAKSEYWLEAKDTLQLEPVNILPEGASAEFTWSSSNENYATVDTNGLVTSIRPGDVTITATTETGVTNSCVLHLTYPVTSITIEDLTVHLGMPAAITATAMTRNAEYINKLMTFSSSDENIITVDEEGNITSVSAGVATVTATATYSGKTATAEVTVVDHVVIIDQEGVEPTCEETGLSPESHCEICGEILSVQEEIPALGHLWGSTQYERSADNAFVTASHVCERDPSHVESETRHTVREIHEIPKQEAEGSYYLYSGEFTNPAFGQVYLGSWPIPALQDLTILTLPADLRVIEEEAFAGISAQAVFIPATVESIGSRAFADSNSLLYVVTYLSSDQIPADAFEGSNLVVLDYRNKD